MTVYFEFNNWDPEIQKLSNLLEFNRILHRVNFTSRGTSISIVNPNVSKLRSLTSHRMKRVNS